MLLHVGRVLCAPGSGQMPHREAFMWGAEQSPKGHQPLLVWYGDPLSSLPSCRAIHFTWLLRLATYHASQRTKSWAGKDIMCSMEQIFRKKKQNTRL